MTNPLIDPIDPIDTDKAAKKIAEYLGVLTSRAGLALEFRISVRSPGDMAADSNRADGDVRSTPAASAVIAVEFAGPDASLLLARNGELLHAMEHVAAKILRLEPEEHDRISFDAEGFKAARDRELARAAARAVEEVGATGQPYTFPAMTSRERRMLHLILSRSGLPTASSGEGPRRFVVLYPEGFAVPAEAAAGRLSGDVGAGRTEAIRERFRRR